MLLRRGLNPAKAFFFSDELGYPLSPRGGLPDGGDLKGDHLHAAAGHLRAAGLRL